MTWTDWLMMFGGIAITLLIAGWVIERIVKRRRNNGRHD